MADEDKPPIPPSPVVDPAERAPRTRAAAAKQGRPLIVRLLPLMIVALALGGFSGIVGYYYFAGGTSTAGAAVPVVKAEAKPDKIRPDKPGGMEVPHQDKEIYDNVVAGRSTVPPTAERLLPPPETPLPRPGTPIGVGSQAPQTLSAAPPRPAGALVPETPPPAAMPASAPPPVVAAARPPDPPPMVQTPPAAPVVAPPRAPSSPGAGVRVAIASVRSEADAHREWDRLRRQHGDALAGLAPDFAPTDLGDRGVFWRIYVGPAESGADAQVRCNALKQRQVTCFVARQ